MSWRRGWGLRSQDPFSRTLRYTLSPMKRTLVLLLVLISMPVCAADEGARLHALFERNWETRLRENPIFATSIGRHEYDDRLPSLTPADLARRYEQTKGD